MRDNNSKVYLANTQQFSTTDILISKFLREDLSIIMQ